MKRPNGLVDAAAASVAKKAKKEEPKDRVRQLISSISFLPLYSWWS